MRASRKNFLAAGLSGYASIGMMRYPAGAAEFTFKLGLDQPASHPMSAGSLEAAAKINRESGGRLLIQVFPDNSLGNDVSMISQLRSGALEMFNAPGSILANVVPIAAMEGIPFAFKSTQQALAALDGPFGANIRGGIEKAGIYPFDKAWNAGFHQVVNAIHPIVTPADLKGLKVRVPPAPLETAMFKALDSSPQPINISETYVALQTHLVDGAALPLATMESFKLFEVQKYLSFTNHLFTSYRPIANADAIAKLPKDLREILDRNFNAAGIRERAAFAADDGSLEMKLKSQGLTPNHPDLGPFRTALQRTAAYARWREQFGADAWALLEKAVGTLA